MSIDAHYIIDGAMICFIVSGVFYAGHFSGKLEGYQSLVSEKLRVMLSDIEKIKTKLQVF